MQLRQQFPWLSRAFGPFAALVAACSSGGPSGEPCPNRVRVYIHDSTQGALVDFSSVRICAGECVVLDRACQVLEGNVVSATCFDGSVRATLAVKAYPDTVTLAVMDSAGAVVHTDKKGGAAPAQSNECAALDVEFAFNYIANGLGGAVGDGAS